MISGKPAGNFWALPALLLWFGNALATPLTLDRLLANFAAISSAHAQFTETQTLAIMDSPLTSSGNLIYRRPDYLKKEVTAPTHALFEITDERLVVESEQGRHTLSLNSKPTIRAFVEAYRATLAGDRAVLEQYYKVGLNGDDGHWSLHLLPLDGRMRAQIKSIEIHGEGTRILRIEILEISGDSSSMTIIPDADPDAK